MGTASATNRVRTGAGRTKAKRDLTGAAPVAKKVATVTVGELRSSFKAVEKKLAKGMRVQVTRRGEVVAEVLPALGATQSQTAPKRSFADHLPEMQARMREIWGDQPVDIDTTALISEGRDRDCLL